jgi:hypothetical protein
VRTAACKGREKLKKNIMKRKATEVRRKQVEETRVEERRKLADVERKEKLARRKLTEEGRMDRIDRNLRIRRIQKFKNEEGLRMSGCDD